jgi:hypothetical protein
VLVGLNDLADLKRLYENSLLGWASIHVGFLNAEQVANVLANPAEDPDFPLNYTSEALTSIARLTNGQPYLVQVIGHLLVQRYNHTIFTENKDHSGEFDEEDVQAVVDDALFYDTAAAYFQGVWGQVTRGLREEILLLNVLARFEDGMDEPSLHRVVYLNEEGFLQSLSTLERHDILCRKDGRVYYTVPLMRRWIRDIHPEVLSTTMSRKEGAVQ